MFRDRKAQQQTLSIRVSEGIREFLDRARQQFSDTRGESLSVSDVAKLLLESAIENRLDDRLETTDLLANPTAALLGIRRKWTDNQPLTRAEWTVLGQYVQSGCDSPTSDPELPSRESFAQLLEALLAVRGLRLRHAPELDHYYVGNLSGWTEQGEKILTAGQQGAEIVPATVRRTIHDLRNSDGTARPPFAGRNIYVALRDERIEGVDSLNRVLQPFLPVLFRLAARGHWLVEHRPIREQRKPWETPDLFPPQIPAVKEHDIQVNGFIDGDGELHMMVDFGAHRICYPLGPYPVIREFHGMVKAVTPRRTWNGRYFFGHPNETGAPSPHALFFREHGKGVLLAFTEEEWRDLHKAFDRAMSLAELEPALSELALAYGEV